MLSLDLGDDQVPSAQDDLHSRAFAEEVQRNAARLARFDLLLWLAAFALLVVGMCLVAWFARIILLTAVPAMLLTLWGAFISLRRWRAVRQCDPVEALQNDRAEDDRARSMKSLDLRLAAITPVGSYLLCGALLATSFVQFLTGGTARAVFLAGLVKSRAQGGDWWRAITGTFVHSDVNHLAVNVVVLFALGRMIEASDRALRLPLVYLFSAACGAAGSMIASSRSSIGASGAVLGMAGYLLVIAGRSSDVPAAVRKTMWSVLGWTLVLGAVEFFRVDHGAHLGGAIGGALVGFSTLPEARRRTRDSDALESRLTSAMDALGWLSWAVVLAAVAFTILRLVSGPR